ncbi:hypothetical protein PWT90_01968 [Aphanocladium album]|nr:hypothetical protein PWT90_01968 [Aphanocladium album]
MPSRTAMDALFGPQLPGHFDFTLLFEHSMLWLVPAGVVILVTPMYFKGIARAQRQVRPGALLWVKLACGLALVGIQASNIALWRETDYFRSDVTIAACSMSLIASICTVAIIAIAHSYSLQPSTFLSVFCSITLFFDITMTRSYFFRETLGAIAVLQVCVVLLKVFLIILEEFPKRGLFVSTQMQSTASAETVSGFWNRSLFLWLNPLLLFGWRNTFTLDNLPSIGDEFASERLFDLFSPYWHKVSKTSKFALIMALARTLKRELAQVFLPLIFHTGLVISQPFLLQSTVNSVSSGNIAPSTSNGLIGAAALLYFGFAVTRTLYEHWQFRAVTFIRGILIMSIYDKMQRLRTLDLENSAAVTLMSTDVDGTEMLFQLVYDIFSCLLQLGLGTWFLYWFVGYAVFLIFIPTTLTFMGSFITGKMIGKARTATNAEAQKRVAATSNVLAQIKSIKSMGLSGSISAYISQKRETEINVAMRERYSVLWTFAFGAINYTISPAIVFAGAYFWTRAENPMSLAELYAVLALLILVTGPLILLFRSATSWATGVASIGRIYDYLLQEELRDGRNAPKRASQETDDDKSPVQTSRQPLAFELNNVSVTSRTTGPVLKEVSLAIPWGSLAMMWGPINSGKSTLLKLLLGEVELNSGTVSAGSSTVAYCSQETWIINCSILEAVIGTSQFVDSRYQAVIRACALDVDIQQLPLGDKTMTGSGGCNLSGGQRQRLSLARAAYAEEEIMVVDDIFSSVDPETAVTVFDRLFGPGGMVRNWNCTVVMTTNRLELLDFADQIYLFSRDGHVTQQGPTDIDGSVHSSQTSGEESNDEASENVRARAAGNPRDTEPPQIKEKEVNDEAPDGNRSVDLSLYSFFLKPAGLPAILSWIIFVMIATVGEWSPVLCLRIWYAHKPEDKRYFGTYAAMAILCVILNVASGAFYFTFVFKKITKGIHKKLLKAAIGATPQYHNETDSGDVLNRFGQDISLATRRLALLINQFVFLLFQTLIQVGLIGAGSAYVVPVMIFFMVVLGLVQFFYLRTSRQLRQVELQSSAALFTQFTESSEGMTHIRAFGWEDAFRHKLCNELNRSQKPRYLLYCIQRWLTLSMDSVAAVSTVVFIAVATKLPSNTTDAAVGLAMLGLIQFSDTAVELVKYWTHLETALGAVRRIKDFITDTPQERDPPSATLPDVWPSAGKIDFNALTATYKTSDGTQHSAIQSLTATIRGGQKIGLMGRTGRYEKSACIFVSQANCNSLRSGKSTIISAVLRMVDTTGSISIDGLDTRHIPLELLRSRITTITQDGLRLNDSLRFNLYPFLGDRPSDDEMISALQSVEIWDHARLNGGLDADYFKIGFSTGQKQLMFLARGILHQKITHNKIVVIDEVTSSLATDLEPQLQHLIDVSFNGCTIIMVSHRKESFTTADGVLQFKLGQLNRVLRRRSNGDFVEV